MNCRMLCVSLVFCAGVVCADWPMAGHDAQRSSYAPEDSGAVARNAVWCTRITPYVPSTSHIVTSKAAGLVYVTSSEGVYALDPANGSEKWVYKTPMPVGHSPTIAEGVMYVPCLDKTVHAINASSGAAVWQTDMAGAGYTVSPLVVNGKVYLGCRDGYFYCFDASDGKLAWYYKTGGPVCYGAAYQKYNDKPDGVVFFASDDDNAYALDALTGKLVWKTEKQLPGDGFYGFWPVIAGDVVLFAGTNNYSACSWDKLNLLQKEAFPESAVEGDDIGATDAQGWMDAARIVDHLTQNPHRKTMHVLNRSTGKETVVAPFLYWGNPSDNRYPPVVGPDGTIWSMTPWRLSHFGQGRYAGWKMGVSKIYPLSGVESADEPEAYSLVGNILYHNDGGDGVDKGGAVALPGASGSANWTCSTFFTAFGTNPPYNDGWDKRRYGNYLGYFPDNTWKNRTGHHGHQNPPVPLDGKVYFHRSNAVICMGP